MHLRTIPAELAREVVDQIDDRLDGVSQDQNVRILLAIESGSRAWGFPSPDSDYDCRFVFVRRLEDYLSPWPQPDVIETPLDAVLDVNGWELGKALKLLLKGNAVILEWLRSPIVYRGDSSFRTELLEFALAFADRALIGRHYLHLGERQRRVYFGDEQSVALKKIFYALRPAAALRWLSLHPNQAIPPMHFPTLMSECSPPVDVGIIVDNLQRQKAITRELGSAPLPKEIGRFIDDEFAAARTKYEQAKPVLNPAATVAAEQLFRRYVSG